MTAGASPDRVILRSAPALARSGHTKVTGQKAKAKGELKGKTPGAFDL
jgi:hypothetical protein